MTAVSVPSPTPGPMRRVLHRVTWSLTPVYNFYTTSDKAQTSPSGTTRLDWHIGYDLSPSAEVYYNRGNLDDQAGRTMTKQKASYPDVLEDIIDMFGVRFKVTKDWDFGGGLYRRWRQCCPGAGDPDNNNPAVQQSDYLDTSIDLGPETRIGKPFSVYAQAGIFSHRLNLSQLDTLPTGPNGGVITPNTLPVLQVLDLTYTFPIFGQTRLVPYISGQEYGTYFNNAYLPVYTDFVQTGLTLHASKYVSYTVDVRNFHAHDSGAATSHFTWLQFEMTVGGRGSN